MVLDAQTFKLLPDQSLPAVTCGACGDAPPDRITKTSDGVVQSASDEVYWDGSGNLHHHSHTQRTLTFRCTRDHTFMQRIITECPTCGWDVDDHIRGVIEREAQP